MAKTKTRKRSIMRPRLTREGQRPLIIYFPLVLFEAMRDRYGARGAAPAIRALVATDVGLAPLKRAA